MAKIKLKQGRQRFRAKTYAHRERSIPSKVTISTGELLDGKSTRAFVACIYVGNKGTRYKQSGKGEACGTGRNPRVALAKAARVLARRLGKNRAGGAFAGIK